MKPNWLYIGAVGALAVMVLASVFIVFQFGKVGEEDSTAQAQVIEKALCRAAIQCYALEGSYPPNVGYLEEHYGILFDHERYFVHYRFDGSNLGPQIRVFESLASTEAD